MPEPARESESLIARARRLDREIVAAGGLAAHWKANADPKYCRLVDPVTGKTLAERAPTMAEALAGEVDR